MTQQDIAKFLTVGALMGLAAGIYFKPRVAAAIAGAAAALTGAHLQTQEQRRETIKDLEQALQRYRKSDGYDPDTEARILQIMRKNNEPTR